MALRAVSKGELKSSIAEHTNPELEAELLGMALWLAENGHLDEANTAMSYIARQPRDIFFNSIYRKLSDAFKELVLKDRTASIPWLKSVLQSQGAWTESNVPGLISPEFLAQLAEEGNLNLSMKSGVWMDAIKDSVSELTRLWTERKLIHAAEDLSAVLKQPGRNHSDVCDRIEILNQIINERPSQSESAGTFGMIANREIQQIEKGESGSRIMTGFQNLDKFTGGFVEGNLAVIAARTSMGKTSFALSLSVAAAEAGFLTGYFSFEMSKGEIVRRLLAHKTRISVLRLRNGDLSDWQRHQVKQTMSGELQSLPLVIDDSNQTAENIERSIRDWKRMSGNSVRLIVIDHLQLMGSTDTTKFERRDLQIARYTSQLKEIAKRYGLVCFVLSQLNRRSDQDQRAPRLSDLRESGAIEQDADAVIGLYRKYPDSQDNKDRSHAEAFILKNRSGPTGRIELAWSPELALFSIREMNTIKNMQQI